MLAIRRAGPPDAPIIIDFNRRLAQESEGRALDVAVLAPGVESALADPGKAIYFLALRDGEVVGQTMITFEWSDWRNGWLWWIQSVYVRPDFRHQGIFRALFDYIRQAAEHEPGVVGLRLYVEQGNTRAQDVYARLGLESTGYFVLERYPLCARA